MGEENWPENVARSRGRIDVAQVVFSDPKYPWERYPVELGKIVADGPRSLVCADCGEPQNGPVLHLKPEIYAVLYKGETFFLERHVGVACGCAKKRGLVP